MVSRSALKLLRKLMKADDWMYFNQIRTRFAPSLEYSTVQSLSKDGYLDSWEPPGAIPVDPEYEIPEIMYRISDRGRALVEDTQKDHWHEFRNWASLFIAVAAFIKSFFF